MTEKMTAVVLYEPGDMRVEQVAVPEILPGEVLVKVAVCGVCGSDISRMNFAGAHRHPIICGHEFSGHVVAVADDVGTLSVGDLITVPPLLPCRKCDSCLEGNFSLCEDYDYFGSRRDGAYADYVTVPADVALVVPANLDPRAAAMVDPCAIALHALLKTKLRAGARVAVIGAGPIGLFAIQWAKILGASEVMALDVNEEKAEMARLAGADTTALDDAEALTLAGKRGYDVIVEAAGIAPTINLAPNLAARNGDVAFIGIPHTPVELDQTTFSTFLRREIRLLGSWNSFSAPFPGKEWTESVRRLADGTMKWEFMITHQLPLSEVPSTMKSLYDRSIFSSKVLFLPGID
jgi:L-iditol 2-dehydrogenase